MAEWRIEPYNPGSWYIMEGPLTKTLVTDFVVAQLIVRDHNAALRLAAISSELKLHLDTRQGAADEFFAILAEIDRRF